MNPLGLNFQAAKWIDGAPLGYQQFENYHFHHNYLANLTLLHRLTTRTVNLTSLKGGCVVSMYPHSSQKDTCTVMLMSNLLEPEWVTVHCYDKLLADVYCSVQNPNSPNTTEQPDNSFCSKLTVSKKCFEITWINTTMAAYCRQAKNLVALATSANLIDFQHILSVTDSKLSPIVSSHPDKFGEISLFTFSERYHQYMHSAVTKHHRLAGYEIRAVGRVSFQVKSNLFSCGEGRLVSVLWECDGTNDCSEEKPSDETSCHLNTTTELSISTGSQRAICSALHFVDLQGKCAIFHSFLTPTFKVRKSEAKKQVNQSLCTDLSLFDDLVADCGPSGQDEPALISMLTHKKRFTCSVEGEIPCRQGHTACFSVTDICVFALDQKRHLRPCRNGGHLQSCKEFECNAMFKCSLFYCIPWSLVCDNKWDCPTGGDEKNMCQNPDRCWGLFKCKGLPVLCIHVIAICDSTSDCPSGDDELVCELKNVECPQKCHCLVFAAVCSKTELILSENIPYLSLSVYSFLVQPEELFPFIQHSIVLRLVDVGISQLCDTIESGELQWLTINLNPITKLSKNCFPAQPKISNLELNENKIEVLQEFCFFHLSALQAVNLSNNAISTLPVNLFSAIKKLTFFSVSENPLVLIQENIFTNLRATFIESDNYHLCCVAPDGSRCTASKPWYISCSNLLPSFAMKLSFLVMSTVIFVANIKSITGHMILLRISKHNIYSVMAISTNVTDTLCGTYLLVIYIAHSVYEGRFAVREKLWRSDPVCFLVFGLTLSFNLITPLILFLLSLSRMMIVVYPVKSKFRKLYFCLKSILCASLFAGLCTIMLTLVVKLKFRTLPTNLCSPFVDPSSSVPVFHFITWFVSLFQTFVSVAILAMHFILVSELNKSQKYFSHSKSKIRSSVPLVFQLIIVTGSNMLCWFPTNIIYVAAMFLSNYPSSMVIWTAVAVAPINSVINPAVFLAAALRRLKELRMQKAGKVSKDQDTVHSRLSTRSYSQGEASIPQSKI